MVDIKGTVDELTQELRRGTLTIAIISQLFEPQYGYSLVSILQEKGIEVDPGTLYPLLRKLEKQELLESNWNTNESRPRKYYLLSTAGKEVYRQLSQEWKNISADLEGLLGGNDGYGID
jgi:PadR family transcriptional regulator, regulatory protein PadR